MTSPYFSELASENNKLIMHLLKEDGGWEIKMCSNGWYALIIEDESVTYPGCSDAYRFFRSYDSTLDERFRLSWRNNHDIQNNTVKYLFRIDWAQKQYG